MMLSLDTAYRSFGGEVEASSTPMICRLPDSRRHQLSAIAHAPRPTALATLVGWLPALSYSQRKRCLSWLALPASMTLVRRVCPSHRRHCAPLDAKEQAEEKNPR